MPENLDKEQAAESGGEKKDALTPEMKENAEKMAAATKKDAEASEKLDKILSRVDALCNRMDAIEERAKKDAEEPEKKAEPAAADAEIPAEIAGLPEETAADKAKKDAAVKAWRDDRAKKDAEAMGGEESAEDPERKDLDGYMEGGVFHPIRGTKGYKRTLGGDPRKRSHRHDANEETGEDLEQAGRKKIKQGLETEEKGEQVEHRPDAENIALKKRLDAIEEGLKKDDDDEDKRLSAQAKADSAYAALGSAAPRALRGEPLMSYRRRLAHGLQSHSKAWKDIDLKILPTDAFNVAEAQIFADSIEDSKHPSDLGDGQLREIVRADSTGRRITEFVGEPRAWMAQFGCNRRVVTGISNGSR